MRVEPHTIGSVLHIVKRGARGNLIAPSDFEKERFLRMLHYLNSTESYDDWGRDTFYQKNLSWPSFWQDKNPLVNVLGWTLMPNHLHLILQEVQEGGVAKFMQRLGGSMSTYYNSLYNEQGSLFQGGYKGRLISDDSDLRYVAAYVMDKNVMELYEGGVEASVQDFENAWQYAMQYPYSSFGLYAKNEHSPILPTNGNLLKEVVGTPDKLKNDIKDMIFAWNERNKYKNRYSLE